MGCTYSNVTVVGSSVDTVREALAGSGALLAESGRDVVVFSPFDEAEGLGGGRTAARLSAVLQVPVVAVLVYDDDVLRIQVFVGGAVAAVAVAPPTGIEVLGEMMGGDAGSIGGDFADATALTVETAPGGDDAAAGLVAAIGRGDADAVRTALAVDNVFASESHADVYAALDLPTDGVGWGHSYLSHDPELYVGTLLDA